MNQDRQALWVTDFSTSHTQVKGDTSELPEVMKDLVRLQRRLSLGPHMSESLEVGNEIHFSVLKSFKESYMRLRSDLSFHCIML